MTKKIDETTIRRVGPYLKQKGVKKVTSVKEGENGLTIEIYIGRTHGRGENEQKVGQAQRNFINATLRQESGATIQPSEFANAKKQYFPQVGDSPAVIKQKAENRARVINSFRIGAGTQGAKHFDETKDPLGLR